MGIRFTDFQLKQALGAVVAATVAGAAAYGLDLSILNSPVVSALLFMVMSVVASLIIPDRNREPSLSDAYRITQAAEQAREAERWARTRDPDRVFASDENQRPEQ